MTSKLDQSLDSIISENRPSKPRKSNKQANNQSNNKQSNRSAGPERRQRKTRNDDTPYSRTPVGFTAPFDNSTAAHLAAANFAAMQQQMQLQLAAQQKQQQQQQKAPKEKPAKQAQAPAVPVKKITGDTIHIANLAKDVTTDDVKEIFEKVGEIRSCSVNYNESGQSLGTATVTFKQSADAERAMNDYDAAEVDGKPMYIKLVGTVSQAPVVVKKKKVEKPAKKADKNPAQPTIPALNPALNSAALNAFMNPAMMNFGATFPFAAPPAAFNGNQPTNRSQSANQSNNRPNKSNNQSNNRSNGQSTARRGQSSRGGRGRGGRTASAQPSMADLDAELDSYHK